MPLFHDSPRPRIAAFFGAEFPVAHEAGAYQRLDALAAALGSEARVVHRVVADPTQQPEALRPRFGSGLMVPDDPGMHANDVEHLRATLPVQFDELIAAFAAGGQVSRPSVVVRPEMQRALSATRWVRAWAPALLLSHGLGEPSSHAMVASHLLGIPRVLVLDSLESGPLAALLPIHMEQARWVVVATDGLRDELLARFGEPLRERLFVATGAGGLPGALLEALRRVVDAGRAATEVLLGPRAAFRTAPPPSPCEDDDGAMLLLGAERTGSNMLVSMLGTRPDVQLANELFNRRLIDADELPWLPHSASPRDELLRLRRADPGALFAALLRDGRDLGAVRTGCKLLYYHGAIDDRVPDMLVARRQLKVLHLRRTDRMRRHVSLLQALVSDRWFASTRGEASPDAPGQVVVDARELVNDFVRTEMLEQRFEALFAENPVLELEYERLVRDPVGEGARVAEFLEVEPAPLQSGTRKTGVHELRRVVHDLDGVLAALRGTRWQDVHREEEGE